MLNFFRGGPLDGHAYETRTLLESAHGREEWSSQVAQYKWTPEVIVSQKTGASARVWVHGPMAAQITAPQPAATVAPGGGSSAPSTYEGADMAEQNLEDRRKAGGFSRNQVAEAAGLTVAKVYRIEKASARTTEEETAQLVAALDKLEAEAKTADPA